ncbi:hypothetical protein Pint_01111 [Pistacia integerrima]|uniref:Uncharacterized protein n=1 Tax=Pistacia integerrima TaxID=434235 RepID=A0ACC0ZJ52_9ROSI|nr:hypothetical protein Pint_01111 [Pistacia integerrima]
MPSLTNPKLVVFYTNFSRMLKILNKRIKRLYYRLRWPMRRRSESKVVIKKFGKTDSKSQIDAKNEPVANGSAAVHPNGQMGGFKPGRTIRVATFNAALFSMAPAVPKSDKSSNFDGENEDFTKGRKSVEVNISAKSMNDRPKSILKQSPLHENLSKQQNFSKSKLRVSINLPDNEISLLRSRQLSFREDENDASSSSSTSISRILKGKGLMRSRSAVSFATNVANGDVESYRSSRTVVEVLRELDADILALQDVKAEEENAMKPLSDLAAALGMNYAFAESWAPEYGNAVLSKWPIKRWKVQKIFDDTDFRFLKLRVRRCFAWCSAFCLIIVVSPAFVEIPIFKIPYSSAQNVLFTLGQNIDTISRNVLKVTVDVPQTGEVNFHCTHLDHLNENWRMKQINAIIQSNEAPHILAGGLNSLDETDYSPERWTDIVKYYEEMGKPTPKVEVMKFLKSKQYTDAKDFAGECESVVMIAKGQSVQGTCKYGTRVDYILGSPNSPYKFVPGSYSVFSSKGTSDHHIVKVDIVKVESIDQRKIDYHNECRLVAQALATLEYLLRIDVTIQPLHHTYPEQ